MQVEYGMIHGRFQPFHNHHLDYLQKALARSRKIIVGITNPDPGEVIEVSTSAHRHLEESNPYTFFQRLEMIQGVLLDLGVARADFRIIPFHIHEPRKWRYYLPPKDVLTHYVRVFSPWEQSKVDRLRAEGYHVEVLDPGAEKGIEASEVRRRIAAGDDSWRDLVPPAVARSVAPTGRLPSGG